MTGWFSKKGMLLCDSPEGEVFIGGDKERELISGRKRIKEFRERNPGKNLEYFQSDTGKKVKAKAQAKRYRNLGYIELNKRFCGCEGHHVDIKHIIYIPEKMHRSVWHSLSRPETMVKINKLAYEFLENNDI